MRRISAVATITVLIFAAALAPTFTAPGASSMLIGTKRNQTLGTWSVQGLHIALPSNIKRFGPEMLAFP